MPKSRAEYAAIFAKLKERGPIQGYNIRTKMKQDIEDPKLGFFKNGVGVAKGEGSYKDKKTGDIKKIALFRILPSEL